MTLGGAAQVAAAHCPNEWTLDPAVCSYKATLTLRTCTHVHACVTTRVDVRGRKTLQFHAVVKYMLKLADGIA